MTGPSPLVSIVIPAYKPDFLSEALESAFLQTYRHKEVIVVDDHPEAGLDRVIRESGRDRAIRYYRNERNLGTVPTYVRCFTSAGGRYVKFLNDDDLLAPDCVARMVRAFERFGERVNLVTSKRRRIDSTGSRLADTPPTQRLFPADSYVTGRDLGDFMLRTLTNVIGEPTTTMFRRDIDPDLFVWNHREYHMNVEAILWLKLLSGGDAVYLADELSSFRQHPTQDGSQPMNLFLLLTTWQDLLEDGRDLGFLRNRDSFREASLRLINLYAKHRDNPVLSPEQRAELSRRRGELAIRFRGDFPAEDLSRALSRLRRVKKRIAVVNRSTPGTGPVRFHPIDPGHRAAGLLPSLRHWLGRIVPGNRRS